MIAILLVSIKSIAAGEKFIWFRSTDICAVQVARVGS